MKKRIEWVDIFKGIAILLVVIGHSNSPINGYIYIHFIWQLFYLFQVFYVPIKIKIF